MARFNPRARVGRDRGEQPHRLSTQWFQSTRPRGARRGDVSILADQECFNPRARVGRDLSALPLRVSSSSFNPRARVGRDTRACSRVRSRCRFNPRARVGRDNSSFGCPHCYCVSIHAPAWGATEGSSLIACQPNGFNPRARVGRDQEEQEGLGL